MRTQREEPRTWHIDGAVSYGSSRGTVRQSDPAEAAPDPAEHRQTWVHSGRAAVHGLPQDQGVSTQLPCPRHSTTTAGGFNSQQHPSHSLSSLSLMFFLSVSGSVCFSLSLIWSFSVGCVLTYVTHSDLMTMTPFELHSHICRSRIRTEGRLFGLFAICVCVSKP